MLVCLSTPRLASAQQAARFDDADAIAIERMLGRYAQAFVTKDYGALRDTLQAPFVRLGAGWDVLATVDEVVAFFRRQREALDAQGFDAARAGFLESRMTVLAPDRALVNKTFRRLWRDGTVLADLAAIYVVSKSSGTWKLCGLLAPDREQFGKVY